MKKRDLTASQFETRLDKEGFGRPGFMGYVQLPDCPSSVSLWNVPKGPNLRRRQLTYLRREAKRAQARHRERKRRATS